MALQYSDAVKFVQFKLEADSQLNSVRSKFRGFSSKPALLFSVGKLFSWHSEPVSSENIGRIVSDILAKQRLKITPESFRSICLNNKDCLIGVKMTNKPKSTIDNEIVAALELTETFLRTSEKALQIVYIENALDNEVFVQMIYFIRLFLVMVSVDCVIESAERSIAEFRACLLSTW